VLDACHGRVEHIHYGSDPLACVDCHGGDPDSVLKETAHPTVTVSFNEATPGVQGPDGVLLAGKSLAELEQVDKEILKFLNPSDYRVAAETCGSPTLGRSGNCHTRITDNSIMSTHATLAGQLAGGLYFGGVADKTPRWALRAVEDPFPINAMGYVQSLSVMPDDVAAMPAGGDVERGHFASYGQLCIDCHLSADGSKVPGKYTSSGCNACHIITSDDSRPLTTDPTQDPEEPGHPERHRFTNLIPDSQCNHCHHAHLHRGLLSQGVRERSEPEGDEAIGGENFGIEDPEHAVPWSSDNYVRYQGGFFLYGKPFPFFIEDEDGTNDIDETPPDIHTEKGMVCIDCHTMEEVHGEDHLVTRRSFETRVRCESCHGVPDKKIRLGISTPFQLALSRVGGNAENPKVITKFDDEFFQLGKLSQKQHPVTQIAQRVDTTEEKFNPRTLMGCGLHAGSAELRTEIADMFDDTAPADVDDVFPGMPEGSSLPWDVRQREGRLECFACHNAWTVNCYGCHVQRDDRVMATNRLTGSSSPGNISTFAMSVIADGLALGFNDRGKLTPMVGTSIFFSHIDASGNIIVNAKPLRTVDGFEGDGSAHNPVHHHTVRRQPRDCQGCHPRADGVPIDEAALKRAIGFGTGEFLFEDGDGNHHILDRMVAIDFDGDGEYDDPATTPLGATAVTVMPMAATTHVAITEEAKATGPGPLDSFTINRMLQNAVVPQRVE